MSDLRSKVTQIRKTVTEDAQKLEAAARGIEAEAQKPASWVMRYPLTTAYAAMALILIVVIAVIHWIAGK
jgi:hypothetical protein